MKAKKKNQKIGPMAKKKKKDKQKSVKKI